MDYGMIAGAGNIASSVIGNYYSGKVAKIQDDTANYVRAQNNTVVAAENARDKELASMSRWRQSVYNKRVYENAAKDTETLAVNHFRQKDNRQRANFAQQIGYAENEGRMQAMAAASGITGGVTDMLAFSMRLKKGMENTARANAERQVDYDYSRRQQEQWFANLDQIDYGLIFDNNRQLDYGVNKTQTPGLLAGVKVADVKSVAQGVEFMFKPDKTPLTFGEGEY